LTAMPYLSTSPIKMEALVVESQGKKLLCELPNKVRFELHMSAFLPEHFGPKKHSVISFKDRTLSCKCNTKLSPASIFNPTANGIPIEPVFLRQRLDLNWESICKVKTTFHITYGRRVAAVWAATEHFLMGRKLASRFQ